MSLDTSVDVQSDYLLFGCHMSEMNFILGGLSGYSTGKYKWALKNPPSLLIAPIESARTMTLRNIHLLESIWRTHDEDPPFVNVIVVDEASRKAVHWILVQLLNRTR